ncbi:MAG: hypothetical protein AAF772_09195, partial [Acidobacteriota bacterium]
MRAVVRGARIALVVAAAVWAILLLPTRAQADACAGAQPAQRVAAVLAGADAVGGDLALDAQFTLTQIDGADAPRVRARAQLAVDGATGAACVALVALTGDGPTVLVQRALDAAVGSAPWRLQLAADLPRDAEELIGVVIAGGGLRRAIVPAEPADDLAPRPAGAVALDAVADDLWLAA